MHFLKLLAILIPACLVIDLVWLGIIMKGFYSAELGDLARRDGTGLAPRWGAAFGVYVLIPAGVALYVRPQLAAGGSLGQAFLWGALFGLIVYGIYDLTNRAVLERWSLRVTCADIAWGGVLCGSLGAILQLAERWLAAPTSAT